MSVASPIVRPLFRPLFRSVFRGSAFDPVSLFANGEQGAFYLPEPQYLYQDSAGTTPVTADGDPVGLMLDKSKGLMLGSEKVANGAFGTDSDWSKGTGWTISNGKARAELVGVSNQYLSQTVTGLTVGSIYKCSFDYVVDAGRVRVNPMLGYVSPLREAGSSGTEVFYVEATASSMNVSIQAVDDGTVLTIDNVSVKELPGNHATQATSASRPVYRATNVIGPDAIDDWLDAGDAFNYEEFSFAVAIKVAADNQRVLDNRGTGSVGAEPGWHVKAGNVSDAFIVDDGAGNAIQWGLSAAFGDTIVLSGRFKTGFATFRKNGVDQGSPVESGGGLSSIGSILTSIGGTLFANSNGKSVQLFGGDLFGALVVNQSISDSELMKIERFLAEKAGVIL